MHTDISKKEQWTFVLAKVTLQMKSLEITVKFKKITSVGNYTQLRLFFTLYSLKSSLVNSS